MTQHDNSQLNHYFDDDDDEKKEFLFSLFYWLEEWGPELMRINNMSENEIKRLEKEKKPDSKKKRNGKIENAK